jgi:hypothetical protein
MIAKRLFLVLAAGALFLLPFADCTSAITLDQQAMKCCGSIPCTPANHSDGCCKNMASAQTPNMLPARHVSLHAPIIATVEYPRTIEIVRSTPTPPAIIYVQQHSPPELYTLHASLLI